MAEARIGPGPIRYHALRLLLACVVRSYVRVRVTGAERLPASGPYIICFNHPSWLDPIVLAATWPDRERRLFILGPREQDMSRGLRNRLIRWSGRGVPFKPHGQDIRDVTRRSLAVLRSGDCLAIAGEGRLSDHEGRILPLETGPAHLARLADAPIVPTAIIGTRWVHLGSRVIIRIGEPVWPDRDAGQRVAARRMTDLVERRLQRLLEGVEDRDPPGWLGRMISEAFNDRPWLEEDGA